MSQWNWRRDAAIDGFSLLEMLVSLVILSLSLGVLYQAAAGATRNARVAGEYSEALIVAESLLSEYAMVTEIPASISGQQGLYDWSADVTPLVIAGIDPPPAPPQHANVAVTVTWPGGDGRKRRVNLETISPLYTVENADDP